MGALSFRRRIFTLLVMCAVVAASVACFATSLPAASHCAMPCCPASGSDSGAAPTCCDVDRNNSVTFTAVRQFAQLQPASVPPRAMSMRQNTPVAATAFDTSFHPAVFQLKVDLRI